jgi:hypothetical protein
MVIENEVQVLYRSIGRYDGSGDVSQDCSIPGDKPIQMSIKSSKVSLRWVEGPDEQYGCERGSVFRRRVEQAVVRSSVERNSTSDFGVYSLIEDKYDNDDGKRDRSPLTRNGNTEANCVQTGARNVVTC